MHALFDPTRFERAIDRIALRRIGTANETSLSIDGISLSTLWRERRAVGRRLAADLRDGCLPAVPGRLVQVQRGSKTRRMFDFPLLELIVHDALAEWLAELACSQASASLFSYRRGRSSYGAVRAFAAYVRRHRRDHAAGQPQGLYVLRRDVHAYFDSIPLHEQAPVWDQLATLTGLTRDDAGFALLRRVLTPMLVDATGHAVRLESGVPTGSPVANVIANLYLADIDAATGQVEGAFYARYGDDILAAHPVADVAVRIRRALDDGIARVGLRFGAEKDRRLHLTASGRPLSEAGVVFEASDSVEFLGYQVGTAGSIALPRAKTRELLSMLRQCALRAAQCAPAGTARRAQDVVAALNRRLDPGDALAHPSAQWLRATVTDRNYLERLDHALALLTAEVLAGRRGSLAFRDWPPHRLRGEFGLRSLVAARNRV